MVLRFKSVVKDRVFDYIVFISLINLIFLPAFLPTALCICPIYVRTSSYHTFGRRRRQLYDTTRHEAESDLARSPAAAVGALARSQIRVRDR